MPSAGRVPTPARSAVRPAPGQARTGDDIPLARRTLSPALKRRSIWRTGLVAGLAASLSAVALVVIFPQQLRRLLAPQPFPGLSARIGLDGRLLGHFPYAEIPSAELVTVAPGVELQAEAAEAFQAMQAAAAADGVDLRVLSAFRSIALQKQIFFDVKSERNQSALERSRVSAPPGFSEHSTGYAVDLGDGRNPASNLSTSFEDSAAFSWLQAHANRFHFHLSFPKGNRQGVSYEPWHWRFEGSAPALKTFEAAQRLER